MQKLTYIGDSGQPSRRLLARRSKVQVRSLWSAVARTGRRLGGVEALGRLFGIVLVYLPPELNYNHNSGSRFWY
jgi:hypothetical protein